MPMWIDQPPPRPRGTSRADRVARARLLIAAALPWLGAVPVAVAPGVVTMRPPLDDAVARIDRAALSAATRARTRLLGEHRAALAELVGDVEAWQAGLDAALAALKAVIHDRAPLPWWPAVHGARMQGTAHVICERAPALATALASLGWWRIDATRRLRADLRWFADHAAALEEVARRAGAAAVLRLCHLAAIDGSRAVAPLVATLGLPAMHDAAPTSGEALRALQVSLFAGKPAVRTTPPAAALGPALLAWLQASTTQPVEARRRALRTIAALRLEPLAAAWASSNAAMAAIEARRRRRAEPTWTELQAMTSEVERLLAERPSEVDVGAVTRLLMQPPRDALLARLGRLPDGDDPALPAVALLALQDERDDDTTVRWLTTVLDTALAVVGTDAWPLLWRTSVSRLARTRGLRSTPPRALGEALGRLVAGAHPEASDPSTVADVLARSRGVDGTLARLAVLRAATRLRRTGGVAAALALGPTLDGLAAATEALEKLDDDDVEWAVPSLIEALGPDGPAVLRPIIAAGDGARVVRAAAGVELASAARVPVPHLTPLPRAGAAPTRYPPGLRAAAAMLEALDAGGRAAAILDETFPPSATTHRELAAIEARLAAGAGDRRLARRADNLRARLTAPRAPSPTRLARLTTRLHLEIATVRLDRWCAALATSLDAALARDLGLDHDVAWLRDARYQRALAGLTRLDGAVRGVATAILTTRRGPPPWDLREASWNRAWLARLAGTSIDLRPWLDGIDPMRLGAPAELTLTLEDDPLEVLRMGEHFRTCLAPDSFNFFAAVVNAADINKRVVYGRDLSGRVALRCLLGLTDRGAIVTFNVYSHGRRDGRALATTFVHELARRMGTTLVPRGHIAPLASPHWYDDGPIDLTGSFGFLSEGDAFRSQLATLAPGELMPRLRAAFAPLPLDGMTLPLVIALPEFDARPALIEPLLPLLDQVEDLPRHALTRAAHLATRAGVDDSLGPRVIDACLGFELHELDDPGLLELLVARAPVRLLGRLRVLRARRGASDRAAWHHAFGRALEAVHRPAKAIGHYRDALHAGPPPDVRAACRARLAALSRPARPRPR